MERKGPVEIIPSNEGKSDEIFMQVGANGKGKKRRSKRTKSEKNKKQNIIMFNYNSNTTNYYHNNNDNDPRKFTDGPLNSDELRKICLKENIKFLSFNLEDFKKTQFISRILKGEIEIKQFRKEGLNEYSYELYQHGKIINPKLQDDGNEFLCCYFPCCGSRTKDGSTQIVCEYSHSDDRFQPILGELYKWLNYLKEMKNKQQETLKIENEKQEVLESEYLKVVNKKQQEDLEVKNKEQQEKKIKFLSELFTFLFAQANLVDERLSLFGKIKIILENNKINSHKDFKDISILLDENSCKIYDNIFNNFIKQQLRNYKKIFAELKSHSLNWDDIIISIEADTDANDIKKMLGFENSIENIESELAEINIKVNEIASIMCNMELEFNELKNAYDSRMDANQKELDELTQKKNDYEKILNELSMKKLKN